MKMIARKAAEERAPKSAARLTVSAIELEGAVILRSLGRLEFRVEAALFRAQAETALGKEKDLILDFTGLEAIDGAGISELVLVHMRARARNCEVSILSPPKSVRDSLARTNIASLFRILYGRSRVLARPARRRP